MTMQALGRPTRKNRNGVVVSSTPYSAEEVRAALVAGSRQQIFRHELHRIVGNDWKIVRGEPGTSPTFDKVVVSASITYDRWATVCLTSASFVLVDDAGIQRDDRIRSFWLLRMPDGNYAEWMVGTFFLTTPQAPMQRGARRRVVGYDSLISLDQAKLTDWFQIPSAPQPVAYQYPFAAGDPLAWTRAFIYDRYPTYGQAIEMDPLGRVVPTTAAKTYEPGTSLLAMGNDLMRYSNYEILVPDVNGSIRSAPFVQPSLRPVDYVYRADRESILVKGKTTNESDLFNAYNQWVRIVSRPDRSVMRARYTLTNGPLGTIARRRTVTSVETVDVADQTTLNQLVARLAEEGQRKSNVIKVETSLMPHGHSDRVRLEYTPWALLTGDPSLIALAAEIDGDYIIRGWTFEMFGGGRMQQTWERCPTIAVSPVNIETTW